MKNIALLLDRDGTLNFDPGYLGDPSLVRLYPGVAEGIAKLKNEFSLKVIVISNQAGIARGIITEEQVISVNNRINEILSKENTSIDKFYYCPYHPDFDSPEKVSCRKPSAKMILQAEKDFNLDLARCYMIGDRIKDIQSGMNAGTKTIIIENEGNHSEIELLKSSENPPNFFAKNFGEVCKFIIKDFNDK